MVINPLLHNNAFEILLYHVFENIMENGAFAPLDNFHNILKSIQNFT